MEIITKENNQLKYLVELNVGIVGVQPGTLFYYTKNDGNTGVELVKGETIGYLLDIIGLIGIENTEYFSILDKNID